MSFDCFARSGTKSISSTSRITSQCSGSISDSIRNVFLSRSSSGSNKLGDPEEDHVQKIGKLYLLKTPIEGCSSNLQIRSGEHSAVDKNKSGMINHWGLLLHYEEAGYYLYIDGGPDEKKIVAPAYVKVFNKPDGEPFPLSESLLMPNDRYEMDPIVWAISLIKRGQLPEIDKIKISPAEFQDIARKNSCNGRKYVLTVNDCQNWAIVAAYELEKYKVQFVIFTHNEYERNSKQYLEIKNVFYLFASI